MAKEQLTIEIDADNRASRALRRLRGELGNLSRVASRAGRMLAGALAAGTAAATAAMAAFTKSVIDVGSESEQARIRLDSLFGSAAEGAAAFDAVREAAARLPFTFSEILGVSSTLSVISDDADELQTRLMQAAEISARFGISLQETAGNMVRFFTAGASSADLFRERGVLAALGVQAGMQTSVEESIRLWNQFFRRIEEQGSSATDRLAESFQGSVSMLQDLWREFRQTVADEGVLDAFKGVLADLREQLRGFIESGGARDFAVAFSNALATMVGAIQGLVNAAQTGHGLIADTFIGRIIGISRTSAGQLAEAQQNLNRINQLLDDLRGGAQLGNLLPRARPILGSELTQQVRESELPLTALEAMLMNAQEAMRAAIDAEGGLADQFSAGTRIVDEFNAAVDRMQQRLRGVSGAADEAGSAVEGATEAGTTGAGGAAGTPGPTKPSVIDAFLRSFGIPSVAELMQAVRNRFERMRNLSSQLSDPLSGPGFEGFGDFQATGVAAGRFGGFSGQLTGLEDPTQFADFGGAGEKAGEQFTASMEDTLQQGAKMSARALVEGLIEGVDDMGQLVKNIGIKIASMLLTRGLNVALGIASPSEMARRSGQQVGLGLALGIEDTFGRVSKAAAGLGRAAIPDVTGPSMSALGATAAAGPVDVMGGFDVGQLQPLSRWAVANDPAFQSLLSASDEIGRQTGRVRRER